VIDRNDFLLSVGRIDSTAPGFKPIWETCTRDELAHRIKRLRAALPHCRGRAEDIREHVEQHIEFLKAVGTSRFAEVK
jgi:hypothetical protein